MDEFIFQWIDFGEKYTARFFADDIDFSAGIREMPPVENVCKFRKTGWNAVSILCDASKIKGGTSGPLPPAGTIGDLVLPDHWKPISWPCNTWTDARIVSVESKSNQVAIGIQWYEEYKNDEKGRE